MECTLIFGFGSYIHMKFHQNSVQGRSQPAYQYTSLVDRLP